MGKRMEATEETVRLLMNTHFPPGVRERVRTPAHKAAEPDGIFPALLQMEVNQISTHLVGIFTACLKFAYTPKAWQEARVTFIPKPGKASYAIDR